MRTKRKGVFAHLCLFNIFTIAIIFILPVIPGSAFADTLILNASQAMALALANNPQLKQNQEKVREAADGKAVAFSGFLPQISASASYTRLGKVSEMELVTPVYRKLPLRVYDPRTGEIIGFTDSVPLPVGADTMSIALGSADNYLLRLNLQQPLFTWGKLFNAYRLAGLNLEAQKAAYEQARQEIKLQALAAFYQALLAEKTANLLKESYEQLQRHVQQVQKLYDNGLASRLDLMRARVSLTNMANQVTQVENGAELARAALRNLTGIPRTTTIIFAEELHPDTTPIETLGALDTARQYRPELVQLRRLTQMADINVRIARTANLPSLFASSNLDYKKPLGFQDKWGKDWNATLGVSWPLFTGLGNLHKLRQAQSRYRQIRWSEKMVEDAIALDVQVAINNLLQEEKNIAYQGENVQLAEEAFRLAEEKYQNGLITNLEFLDTQLALTQSRLSYFTALANYQVARAKYLRAIGKF